ncbi:19206_t:CDS:1 [Gigaspora margarita]|uniref:19206_t:CDS:1 n=1 Tax=Gigaspora margarita TaxID=4874 RepID=A0ABN7V8D6_GIGMA|nr:19206_t:CDS:1 [Gigaspora margarita]
MTKLTFKTSISITFILSVISYVTASFLNDRSPFVLFENANENIENAEAAHVNQFDIQALNAAESASSADHEQSTTFLLSKRHFLQGFQPFILYENANENIENAEAAHVNQFDIQALNAAEAASSADHEHSSTFLLSKRFILLENADENIVSS